MKSVYFKFYTSLLLNLIKYNPVKIIFIILSIISWQFIGAFEDVVYKLKVDKYIEISGTHLYISKGVVSNEIKYKINQYDSKQEIVDGNLVWKKYSNWGIFFCVVFVISTLMWIISTLIGFGDDDIGWDLDYSIKESILSVIYCEEENRIYYYMAFGRLIGKRDHQVKRNDFLYEFGINSLKDILFCPKFKIKTSENLFG